MVKQTKNKMKNKLQMAIHNYCLALDELWGGQTIEVDFAAWYCFGDISIPFTDLVFIVDYEVPMNVYLEYLEAENINLKNFVKYGN